MIRRFPLTTRGKILFGALLLTPLLLYAYQYQNHLLGDKAIERLNHRTGTVAYRLLCANLIWGCLLALNWVPRWSRPWTPLRRQLGIVCFVYLIFHVALYVVKTGDLATAWEQIFENAYLWTGLIALLILFTLTITSTNWATRTLRQNWGRLHRLVYAALVFVILHFVLFEKHHAQELAPLLVPLTALYLIRLYRARPWTRTRRASSL